MKSSFYLFLILILSSYNNMTEIEKALQIQDETKSIIAISEILSKKAKFSDNFENLTEPEKTFIFVEMFETEVNNGGFNQFFYNSSGDFTYEVLDGLKKIGALRTAKILEEAYAIFPINPIPNDIEKRRDILKNVDSRTKEKWNELEDRFYAYEENIGGLLLKYVNDNLSQFK